MLVRLELDSVGGDGCSWMSKWTVVMRLDFSAISPYDIGSAQGDPSY